jgi:hypothetical protein
LLATLDERSLLIPLHQELGDDSTRFQCACSPNRRKQVLAIFKRQLPYGSDAGKLVVQMREGFEPIIEFVFFQNLRLDHRACRKQLFPLHL